jgi:hypothetical protein
MGMKRVALLLMSLLFITIASGWAQVDRRNLSPAGHVNPDFYFTKPVNLIDLPTASILRGGDVKASLRLYEEGGMLARLSAGISSRVMFGVSYGCDHLIGGQDVHWNEMPGVHFAYRVIDESLVMPALVVGLDTQGYGKYYTRDDYPDSVKNDIQPTKSPLNRYANKSRGFYVVASKGYESLWKVGLHAGINYSLERSDKDTDPDFFLGMDLQLSRDLAAIFEYDFALNDDRFRETNSRKGYLNAGVRWAFQEQMFIEFDLKNILADSQGRRDFIRILRIGYYSTVFDR